MEEGDIFTYRLNVRRSSVDQTAGNRFIEPQGVDALIDYTA